MNARATLDAALRKVVTAPSARNEQVLILVFSAADNYKRSSMDLGSALSTLRNQVPHGHWARIEEAVAVYLAIETKSSPPTVAVAP